MKSDIRVIIRYMLDIFYPNRCPCCDKYILWNEYLCSECKKKMENINDKVCRRCGKEICVCKEENFYYDKVYACYFYEGIAAKGIIALKKGQNINFGYYIAEQLYAILSEKEELKTIDYIIPVPMPYRKKIYRGYNQAALIAKEIAKMAGVKYKEDILVKKYSNISQHTLNAQERQINVQGYAIKDVILNGKNIIICDDVITTGSTINRCSELLKSKGAKNVIAISGTITKLKDNKKE